MASKSGWEVEGTALSCLGRLRVTRRIWGVGKVTCVCGTEGGGEVRPEGRDILRVVRSTQVGGEGVLQYWVW